MARTKNALRKHYVASIPAGSAEPEYLHLAKWVSSITDSSDEEVEETAYYDGDGTKESNVTAIAEKWAAEGTFDPADEAQKLIADMKRKTGDDRKIIHKIEFPDGQVVEGVATVTDIIAGGGDASDYGEFKCTISYDTTPTVKQGVSGASIVVPQSASTSDKK